MGRDSNFFTKVYLNLWRRLAPREALMPDLDPEVKAIIHEVTPYTMTSLERINGLVHAVRYIVKNDIPGDIVECGVWKGGSMMAVARTLLNAGCTNRHLYLYDTYAGMTAPTEKDGSQFGTKSVNEYYEDLKLANGECQWCYSSLEETRKNVLSVGYPEELIHFVKGPVEDTIPGTLPGNISILRLDTDFYESSRHELIHLFPLLSPGGVLLLDDYGHWEGQRKAVDEYFDEHGVALLLNRLDYTGRIGIKP